MDVASDRGAEWIALVRSSYNTCADAYSAQRTVEHRELDLLSSYLEEGSAILDVGCGSGVPVTLRLSSRFCLTGVDISDRMIELAKAKVPNAEFIRANILEVDFAESSFDAIISFYALFHIPRNEQPNLFRQFYKWIKPGGLIFATYAKGGYKVPGYTEDDFFGTKMYWSNFPFERFRELMSMSGFEELRAGVIGHGYKDIEEEPEITPYVFARSTKRSEIT
jgi:ubiquinone/menaquinone biosynthesis C-methylase UbiE